MWFSQESVIGRKPQVAGIVNLIDKRREPVGMAFCSPLSKIFLRIFVRSHENVDKNFWRERIKSAYQRRVKLALDTNAFRIVHSESDGIPSVMIDKYNDIYSIQISSAGAETIKKELIEIIREEFEPRSIVERNNIEVRKIEGLPLIQKIIFGNEATTIVREEDQKFQVDVLSGQKTGAFLDYRGIRRKAAELASGVALDAFCYQGWGACQMAKNARKVVAIDVSGYAIAVAKENASLNGHKNISFVCEDVFDYLEKCDLRFDLVHLDPPSFIKSRDKLPAAVLGYKKLIMASLKKIKHPGILLISSCSHHITERILEDSVIGSVKESSMECEVIYRGIQDKDHPILKGFPEALYLKALAVKIV